MSLYIQHTENTNLLYHVLSEYQAKPYLYKLNPLDNDPETVVKSFI